MGSKNMAQSPFPIRNISLMTVSLLPLAGLSLLWFSRVWRGRVYIDKQPSALLLFPSSLSFSLPQIFFADILIQDSRASFSEWQHPHCLPYVNLVLFPVFVLFSCPSHHLNQANLMLFTQCLLALYMFSVWLTLISLFSDNEMHTLVVTAAISM